MLNSPVFYWGKSFVDKINLNHYKKILEIGCRSGELSAYLAKQYKRQKFTAIDNIEDNITQAKTLHSLSNLTFETVDALSLPYTENFDAVVSFSCLHWIGNKAKILKNIYQSLKPGGKTFIQFFALHGRPKNDRFFYQLARHSKWKSYFKQFTPNYSEITLAEVTGLLQSFGFIIHHLEFSRHETIFDHSSQLHRWLSTWVSHLQRVPKRKQDFFLDESIHQYLSYYQHTGEDKFPYYEYLLEVICEKPLVPAVFADTNHQQYGSILFTQKEINVLKYYLKGMSAKEISFLIPVSAKTIEFHLDKIKAKLNCHRRSEVYQSAITHGFINLILY